MVRLPGSRVLVVGAAVAVSLVTAVMPLAYMVITAVGEVPARVLLLDARQRALLSNSLLLAVTTATAATLIGAPLGFGLARMALPMRNTLRVVLAAPILLPPYIVALAWIYIGGSAGTLAAIMGRDLVSGWTYSLPAAAVVLALVYYPIVMLATEAALRQVDPRLEESGLVAAPVGRVLTRITLPLVGPAIGGAALIVAVLAISEFGVPALLRVRVYTTEVFTAFAALFDVRRATALTVPLLIVTAATSAIAVALLGTPVIAGQRQVGSGSRVDLPFGRLPIRLLGLATIAVAVVLPVVVLWNEAEGILGAARGSWASVQMSVVLAATGATLVVLVGATLGYARARIDARVGHAADVLCVVIFAVPSTVVGVALIGLWNRPGPTGVLYGTIAMLLLAYLARFVPVAALVTAASVRQIPLSQEEAAAAAGAGWLRTIVSIVIPQATRGLTAAWVIAFVFAFGELGASILVVPPGESTLPIRIYTLIANTPASTVAALALLQVAVIAVPVIAGAVYAARRTSRA
jgi:iron(III) transport system permease protein